MKVLLIDDHPLILAALQSVIQGLGDDVTVLGVGNEHEARRALEATDDYDLVLLDLQLGETDGFDLLAEFRQKYPALPIVVVSASDRASDVIRAIDTGAMGYVPKRTSNEVLSEALRLVMSGGIYVPSMQLGGVIEASPAKRSRAKSPPTDGDTAPGVMRRADRDEGADVNQLASSAARQELPLTIDALGLSRRQSDVLAYMLKGMPNKIIARELHISIETVKDHVAAVLRALKVSSRTQAVLMISQMTQQQTQRGGATVQAWKPSKP